MFYDIIVHGRAKKTTNGRQYSHLHTIYELIKYNMLPLNGNGKKNDLDVENLINVK